LLLLKNLLISRERLHGIGEWGARNAPELLERELRRAMKTQGIGSLPLYPEGRACRRPTARKVINLFEDVQNHELITGRRPAEMFTTELTRVQRRILRL
jgi:hypothetical protein